MEKLYNFVNFSKLKPCGEMTERTRLFTGYACNIKCGFCFYRNMKHIDIRNKIEEQIHWGYRYGIKDWDISGGEPSILPYWFAILASLKTFGFRNIACITNGYKFADPDFLKKSKELGLNELLFSLHGPRRHVHDEMTGVKGSFDHIQRAIANAKYYGIKIRINVVVTKRNYLYVDEIAKMMQDIKPVAFNFLPFRVENSADRRNVIQYSKIAPFIMDAIEILKEIDNDMKIAVRYVPFCLYKGYEKYVAGYLQREFDEYEWNEYTIRKFENARHNKKIPELDLCSDDWDLEINALHQSIKHVAGHSMKCLGCKYLNVCDGIWYSYAKEFGIDEFNPVAGVKTKRILQDEV